MATLFNKTNYELVFPTDEEIEKYRQDYARWILDLKKFVAEMQTRLAAPVITAEFVLLITNEGSEPADDVIVNVETLGQFSLDAIGRKKAELKASAPLAKSERFRDPPVAPGPRRRISRQWQDMLEGTQALKFLSQIGKREPAQWAKALSEFPNLPRIPNLDQRNTSKNESSTRWRFECAEIRHRAEPMRYSLQVIADLADGERTGALRVKVSARNLRAPDDFTLPINLSSPSQQGMPSPKFAASHLEIWRFNKSNDHSSADIPLPALFCCSAS
jgi:hypothetical protein